jgi:hypothetical protein
MTVYITQCLHIVVYRCMVGKPDLLTFLQKQMLGGAHSCIPKSVLLKAGQSRLTMM